MGYDNDFYKGNVSDDWSDHRGDQDDSPGILVAESTLAIPFEIAQQLRTDLYNGHPIATDPESGIDPSKIDRLKSIF